MMKPLRSSHSPIWMSTLISSSLVTLSLTCFHFAHNWISSLQVPGTSQQVSIHRVQNTNIQGIWHNSELWPKMDRAVAIGEVGIDYMQGVSEHTIHKQHHVLEEVVYETRDLNKPVVIHCRRGRVERNATLDCLTIVRAILPQNLSHLCTLFHGGFQDFKQWLQAFLNVVFGFTGSLLTHKNVTPSG